MLKEIRPIVVRYKLLLEQEKITKEGLKLTVPKLISTEEYEYITGTPFK